MQIGGKRRFGKSSIFHNDELAAIHTLFFKPLHNGEGFPHNSIPIEQGFATRDIADGKKEGRDRFQKALFWAAAPEDMQ